MDWLSYTDLTNENGAIMLGNAEVKPNLSLAAKHTLTRPGCLKRATNGEVYVAGKLTNFNWPCL